VYDAELWEIGLALRESVNQRDILQANGVTKVAVFNDLQAAIRRTEHLELGPGRPLARLINRNARALREVGIETEVHWVPGSTVITGNERSPSESSPRRPESGHGTRANIHLSSE
jgi:hypothetical protein